MVKLQRAVVVPPDLRPACLKLRQTHIVNKQVLSLLLETITVGNCEIWVAAAGSEQGWLLTSGQTSTRCYYAGQAAAGMLEIAADACFGIQIYTDCCQQQSRLEFFATWVAAAGSVKGWLLTSGQTYVRCYGAARAAAGMLEVAADTHFDIPIYSACCKQQLRWNSGQSGLLLQAVRRGDC
jgi:hypothetical protein